MRVTLEGNIACGKTTVLNSLPPYVSAYTELLTKWEPFLKLHDADPPRWAMTTQMRVLLDLKNLPNDIICERSPYSARHIFIERHYMKGNLTPLEYSLLDAWYDDCGWMPDLMIYLKVAPSISFQRMKARGRDCEQNVSLETLQQINHLHEQMIRMCPFPVFTLDGNQPTSVLVEEVVQILKHHAPSTMFEPPPLPAS